MFTDVHFEVSSSLYLYIRTDTTRTAANFHSLVLYEFVVGCVPSFGEFILSDRLIMRSRGTECHILN
jgi:hypothetical protein